MHDPVDVSPLDVRGSVRVELFDDRTGRLVERQDGENFVSFGTRDVLRWWQRLTFGAFSPGTAVADGSGTLPYHMPRHTFEHLAYWTDDATEDPATEYRLHGEVVGWASRWPVGSPTGRRGVVDVGASVNGPGYSTWQFNWTTSQGNGTFQSVGWTRLVEANAMPIPRFPDPDAEASRVSFVHTNSIGGLGNPKGGSGTGALAWDAAESKWVTFERQSVATPILYLQRFDDSPNGAASGAKIPISWPDAASNNGGSMWDVAKLGDDWVCVGRNGTTGLTNNGHLRRFPAAGNTTPTWSKDIVPGSGQLNLYGVTVDGDGKIWTAGSDGVMRRHDPANGDVEVSVTPWRTPSELRGIAWDDTAARLWISGLWDGAYGVACVDTDGTLDGPTFGFPSGAQVVTASAPFAGYRIPGVQTFDDWYLVRSQNSNSTTSGVNLGSPSLGSGELVGGGQAAVGNGSPGRYGGGLVWRDGSLYSIEGGGSGSTATLQVGVNGFGATGARVITGHNLGTRLRLSSPVTKTNAQNLRITYRFDFA